MALFFGFSIRFLPSTDGTSYALISVSFSYPFLNRTSYGWLMNSQLSHRIVAALSPHLKEKRLARFQEVLGKRTNAVHLVLENPDDHHNVSAVLRTCDGFGLQNVSLIEGYSKAATLGLNKDVSKGSEKFISVTKHTDAWAFLETAGQKGSLIATEMGAPDIGEIDWANLPRPLYVVLGNETRGVSKLVRQNASHCVSLPSWGMVQSFNVSVASALVLSHLYGAKVLGDPPPEPLSEDEQAAVLAKWLISDVPASNVILKRANCVPENL